MSYSPGPTPNIGTLICLREKCALPLWHISAHLMEGFARFEWVSGWHSQTVTSWRITISTYFKCAKALRFNWIAEGINCGAKILLWNMKSMNIDNSRLSFSPKYSLYWIYTSAVVSDTGKESQGNLQKWFRWEQPTADLQSQRRSVVPKKKYTCLKRHLVVNKAHVHNQSLEAIV